MPVADHNRNDLSDCHSSVLDCGLGWSAVHWEKKPSF